MAGAASAEPSALGVARCDRRGAGVAPVASSGPGDGMVSRISRSHRQGSPGTGVNDQPEPCPTSGDAGLSSITRNTTRSGGAGRARTCDRRIMSPLGIKLRTCNDVRNCYLTCGLSFSSNPCESHRFRTSHGFLADCFGTVRLSRSNPMSGARLPSEGIVPRTPTALFFGRPSLLRASGPLHGCALRHGCIRTARTGR